MLTFFAERRVEIYDAARNFKRTIQATLQMARSSEQAADAPRELNGLNEKTLTSLDIARKQSRKTVALPKRCRISQALLNSWSLMEYEDIHAEKSKKMRL